MNVVRRAKRSTIEDATSPAAPAAKVYEETIKPNWVGPMERPHQLRPQRHDNHEVDDRRELNGRQDEQHHPFAALRAIRIASNCFLNHRFPAPAPLHQTTPNLPSHRKSDN